VIVIDPSGKYLLVTSNFSSGGGYNGGDVSVFSIDPNTGALSPVGSPVPANTNPTEILFTHSGKFVYVTNPEIGMVTGFSFTDGVLTLVPGTPVSSGEGGGALGLAVGWERSVPLRYEPFGNQPSPK
jgi:DNA-binding beta-propeller fold protein YncE